MCGDLWDLKVGHVVCHMLGFSQALDITKNAKVMYGEGKGRVWLSKVDCRGNETNLVSCKHLVQEKGGCSHGNIAGVVCKPAGRG